LGTAAGLQQEQYRAFAHVALQAREIGEVVAVEEAALAEDCLELSFQPSCLSGRFGLVVAEEGGEARCVLVLRGLHSGLLALGCPRACWSLEEPRQVPPLLPPRQEEAEYEQHEGKQPRPRLGHWCKRFFASFPIDR
jgi:hypothetical protein